MKGWLKLYRKISNSSMYKALNSKQRDVMMQCLILANHVKQEWQWGADVFECKPGQFITSLPNLKSHCAKDVSIQSIRTCLLILVKWQFLTNESTETGRLITICNWDRYQGDDIDTQQTDQQTTNRQLTSTKNNIYKNVIKKKEEYKNYLTETDDKKYHAFVDYLFGNNEVKEPFEKCLSLNNQISPENFNTLMRKYSSELIKSKIDAMENTKDLLKRYTSFYKTLNIWCRNEK